MQPHPIPQNVTSFQFRLIGDMTLKQFLYLASGSAIAYVAFLFLAPFYPIIGWPITILSALLGVAFAFLPINSRPLDYWLGAFLKAIYSPTKRVWKKNGKTYKEDALFNSRYITYLASLQPRSVSQMKSDQIRKSEASEPERSDTLTNRNTGLPLSSGTPISIPTGESLGKTVDLAKEAQNLQMKIIQTERALTQVKSQAQTPASQPADYNQQVTKIIADLQNLVMQASQIKQQMASVEPVRPNTPAVPLPIAVKPKVKVVISDRPKTTQVALTTFPNVINGFVKDDRGNYLEGVVVVIYDKEGLPVRALKTNKLGQFTGSTPLPNGTYTIELEKENLTFDVLQLDLNGQVLSPLTVVSKVPAQN